MAASDSDEDVLLIKKYKNGDKPSLEKLYNKYKIQLLKLVWYYVYNIHDAEDILQMIFLKVIKNIGQYSPNKDVKFKSWLFRVAINTAKDFIKKKRPEFNPENIDEIADTHEKTDDNAINDEMIKKMKKSVLLLPLKYREVITLIYFEELKYEEAAAILKKPLGTIKSRTNYAINLLRKKFNNRE